MENTKKHIAMMAALLAVVLLLLKLRTQVSETTLNLPATPNAMQNVDPFLLPYLQTNPGIWDGQFGGDPFDKVFNVSLDNRDASEHYIPMFGFVGSKK